MRDHAYNPLFWPKIFPGVSKNGSKFFGHFYQLLIKYLGKLFQTEKLDFNLFFSFRSFRSLAVRI